MKGKLKIGIILSAALLLVTAFAEKICPYDPYEQNLMESLQQPSLRHLMGTDMYGRDLLSRVLVGSRTSIYSALILIVLITVFGTLIGLVCGYHGGVIDSLLMRISDICLAFPGLVFALAVAAILGGGIANAVIALAVISWPKYARVARSQTLAIKNTDYIRASILSGSRADQIIARHILPNVIAPVLVTSVLDIGTMMMELAGLSFLGLGALPPSAELGSMISSGRSMLQTYPWVVMAPGIAIFISVAIFNLLGDAVRDWIGKN